MTRSRFAEIAAAYGRLRIAVVGDFCLDRYLEIDPSKTETSLETGLRVHNVVHVRAQPGAAGTVLNNLAALRIGRLHPVGFCGEDGEGFELRRALAALPGVRMDHFITTPFRHTFTYCKPLVLRPGAAPQELSRLDLKNWTPTPALVVGELRRALSELRLQVDAVVVMDQVDVPDTGVVCRRLTHLLAGFPDGAPGIPVIADCRRGLRGYPPVIFKMNASELAALMERGGILSVAEVREAAGALARRNGCDVFVTLADRGIVGASPGGEVEHVPALPVRGPIDIVGAGDAVTANLAAALAAGATLREALELAMLAASVVIHQLGTTGTAGVEQMAALLP